jgi:hypothetical protein
MRDFSVRAVALVFALTWLVFPGFGLIDLSVTWSADWPQALEAGWGSFSTLLAGAAFAVAAARPRALAAPVAQLAVAAICLAVSALASSEPSLFLLAGLLTAETAILAAVGRPAWPERDTRASRPLLLLAAVGAAPWLVYAVHMWAANREGDPVDVSVGVDHYAVQGALGLALALLPALAALRPSLFVVAAACAGAAASYLGLVSAGWPHSAGGLASPWSIAAILWGLALIAVTARPRIARLRSAA